MPYLVTNTKTVGPTKEPSEEKTSASHYMQADVTVEADRTRVLESWKLMSMN
jgi:hypothetical protein